MKAKNKARHELLFYNLGYFSGLTKKRLSEEIAYGSEQIDLAKNLLLYLQKRKPNFECEMEEFFESSIRELTVVIKDMNERISELALLLKKKK